MNYKQLQATFFDRLKGIYKGDQLIPELCSLLDLQQAAVYKRVSGDTMIKFDELVKIATHFQFSIESIFNANKRHISFQFDLVSDPPSSYRDILAYIVSVFDSFRNLPSNTLMYSSKHLPFMHYLKYPVLFEIHMHMWQKTSFPQEHERMQEGNIRSLTAEDKEMMAYMVAEYERHPITEIWGPMILEDIFTKVRFLVLSNVISSHEYLEDVLSNLRLLVNRLKLQTSKGAKDNNGSEVPYKVYINELELGVPLLYYESKIETKTFLIHQEPNFIYTYQKGFCDYSRTLLQNIIDSASQISGQGTRDRIKYFHRVDQRLESFATDIRKVWEYAQL